MGTRVYVGELGDHAEKRDLEEVFSKYGALDSIWLAANPPGFGFVEFIDHRDAADAVKALDGIKVNNRRWKVEHARGPKRSGGGGGYGGGGRSRSRSPRRRRSPSPRRRRSPTRTPSPLRRKKEPELDPPPRQSRSRSPRR